MNLYYVFGDAFWILALSIIANALWLARTRIPAAARLPLPWGLGALPQRWPRNAAFAIALGVPFVLSLVLLVASRAPGLANQMLLVALVRLFTAGLAAALNVFWLNGVLRSGGD